MNITQIVIAGVVLVSFIIFISLHPSKRETKMKADELLPRLYGRKFLKEQLGNTLQSIEKQLDKKNEFRNQMRVLTLSLTFTMIGFVYSKAGVDLKTFLWVPIVFNVFMYGLDTFELDLFDRQVRASKVLLYYYTHCQSLNKKEVQCAGDAIINLLRSYPTSVKTKFNLLFTRGRFDKLWYGIPTLIILCVWLFS